VFVSIALPSVFCRDDFFLLSILSHYMTETSLVDGFFDLTAFPDLSVIAYAPVVSVNISIIIEDPSAIKINAMVPPRFLCSLDSVRGFKFISTIPIQSCTNNGMRIEMERKHEPIGGKCVH
jgi:hypothetical protein